MRTVCVVAIVLSLAGIVTAEQKKSCATPEYRQFDFWVGEWNVDQAGKEAGASSVQLILDGCIVFENWTGAKGYNGKSFNLYNATLGKWQQYWVDNAGGVLVFTGEYKDNSLRYEGVTPQKDGSTVLERLTFFKLSANQVRQLWEQSKDQGKTWAIVFDGNYVRKK